MMTTMMCKDPLPLIARRIRTARLERGLTQRALSKLAGVQQGTIYKSETGLSTPSPTTTKKLADALGVDCHYLTNSNAVDKGKCMNARKVIIVSWHEESKTLEEKLVEKIPKGWVPIAISVSCGQVESAGAVFFQQIAGVIIEKETPV